MHNNELMQPLTDALDACASAGQHVDFWLRDDDAVQPSDSLNRLLLLTKKHEIPVMLAVIPAHSDDKLSQYLARFDHVSVAVHGWSHQNHAPREQKKQELGEHRSASIVLKELAYGYEHLSQSYPSAFVPVLVPPWNRISATIVSGLHPIGYKALSTFGINTSTEISMLDTHVDIIDWKGSRGGRDLRELVEEMASCIQDGSLDTIGLLTHHQVHDSAAWLFLECVFPFLANHRAARWTSISSLLVKGRF
ncbi:MAG: polysaccharide deacetylase family protein [Granulosicoccus sp.]|nr:polysaccharide deacetylase family protein [Granulosicoccus sp.]